jgi:L-ascorbate metabolism protein UlaG (beta-lactamase superfamily)
MDHVGDTIALAGEIDAEVVANPDLGDWLGFRGVKKVNQGNTGGTIHTGGFSVTFTNALHSSAHMTEDGVSHSLGSANGLMLHFDDEPSLLHMGDTDIFSDMALINELHQPDIGLVPVGDRFTMGGAVAALACQRYFNFGTVIPCHYGTFGIIDQTAEKFVAGMEGSKSKIETPAPGGTVTV